MAASPRDCTLGAEAGGGLLLSLDSSEVGKKSESLSSLTAASSLHREGRPTKVAWNDTLFILVL